MGGSLAGTGTIPDLRSLIAVRGAEWPVHDAPGAPAGATMQHLDDRSDP